MWRSWIAAASAIAKAFDEAHGLRACSSPDPCVDDYAGAITAHAGRC